MGILKLTPDQTTEYCRFPIGCPVWVYSNDKLKSEAELASPFIQEGVIRSFSINMISKIESYEVKTTHSTLVVTEDQLVFGCGSTVFISSERSESNDTRVSGTVLVCAKNGENTTYTVRYTETDRVSVGYDIAADLVTYRKAEDYHAVEDEICPCCHEESMRSPDEDKTTGSIQSTLGEENIIVSTTSESPLLQGSVGKEAQRDESDKDNTASNDTHPNKKQKLAAVAPVSKKSARWPSNCSGPVRPRESPPPGEKVCIPLPLWLYKDQRSKEDLFSKCFGYHIT
jgi:hypothetical protein